MKMADVDAQEPLSNISDSSFVILGEGSIPPTDAEENPKEYLKPDSLTNSKSGFSVLESTNTNINDKCENKWLLDGSSLYEEDTQRKLDEILKENSQLKETLVQNNLAIKSQLDTFFMWQQEVLKTHEIHKQKFLETKDLILKLRAENINLKRQLEESAMKGFNINGDVQADKKPEELEELKARMKEFEDICNSLTGKNETLVKENEKLREELKAENREIINLNKKLQSFESEVEGLKQSMDSSRKYSLESSLQRSSPNAEAQMQISNLLKELEESKENQAKLSEELEKLKSGISDARHGITQELSDKVNDVNACVDIQNQKSNGLQSWVALAEENLTESKVSKRLDNNLGEINKLQGQLNRNELASIENEECMQESRSEYEKLLLDYQDLQQQLNKILLNGPDVADFVIEVSKLSSELEEKDRELLSKEEECKKLREVIKNLQAECEDTAALRVQVQLHRDDFIDVRKEKDLLTAKNEELAEKIELLESAILVLEQENESPERKERVLCPRCVHSFPDLVTYQNHIEDCCYMDYFH